MRFRVYWPFLVVSAFAAGCGGGSGGSVTPTPTGNDFAFGDLIGRAAVTNPPVTTAAMGTVSTAFTGTFSSLKLRELNPSLAETRIYFAKTIQSGGQFLKDAIFSCAPDGSNIAQLTPSTESDFGPALSPSGRIAFTGERSGLANIFVMNLDGTGETQLTTDATPSAEDVSASIDAAGDKVAYVAPGTVSTDVIKVVTVATKAAITLQLVANTVTDAVAISSDGANVYSLVNDGSNEFLYRQPATAIGTPALIAGAHRAFNLSLSPDNLEVGYVGLNDGTLYRQGLGTGQSLTVDIGAGDGIGASYSPDGKNLAYSFTGASGGPQLFVENIATQAITQITSDPNGPVEPCWGPFTKDRTLIATTGALLGTRACGVISSQRGTTTASVVAFDVTTPSSVVMTAQTPPSGDALNLVFSADADTITKLTFANGIDWKGVRAIGSSTPVVTANGALISIDAATGVVVSVLPFNGTRAEGDRPTIHDNGTVRTFEGHFLAVYDKSGKNLAPNGASQVILDTKTDTATAK